jgi:hypothetical protein
VILDILIALARSLAGVSFLDSLESILLILSVGLTIIDASWVRKLARNMGELLTLMFPFPRVQPLEN